MDPRSPSTPDPFVPERVDDLELGELVGGWDWLTTTCTVLQTVAMILIAITLVVRL